MSGRSSEPIWSAYYILKFDKEIDIGQSHRTLIDQNAPKHKKVLRGTLLEPISHGQAPKKAQRGGGKLSKFRCLETKYEMECAFSEVARITRREKDLLAAIPTTNDRYTTYFKPDFLTKALALKKGSHVNVLAKVESMKQILPGVVQYIGEVPNQCGTLFGIELQGNHGCGTSDGEFGKKRFFQTEKDSAMFVAVNKLDFDTEDVVVPRVAEHQLAGRNSAYLSIADYRQSFVESDLKKDMDVYVCSKKGIKEEWVKGKIIYIGKPPGEAITYCGVEMEKPRIKPWDGTFKSNRLCTPLKLFYSELVEVNDVVPATLLEGSTSLSMTLSSISKPGPLKATNATNKNKAPVKRPNTSANSGSNKNRAGVKNVPGYATKQDESDTGYQKGNTKGFSAAVHDFNYPLRTIQGHNVFDTLAAGTKETSSRGADENLKIQQQLLDKAGKNKEPGSNATAKEGRMKKLTKTKDNFFSKLPFGGNKDDVSLRAGISFSALVSGKVAMVDLTSPLQIDVTDLPPISTHLLEQIYTQVDQQWAYFGSSLRIEQAQIEKIAGKYEQGPVRVMKILMYWWRDASKMQQAMQTLAFVLSDLKLDKLAGDILTEHFSATITEGKMDMEMLEHVARDTAKGWQMLAHHLGLEDDVIKQIKTATNIYKDQDRAKEMLLVWDKEISIASEKMSLLVRACRNSGFADLANELEQGLDTDTLNRISRLVDETKWRLFGESLGFPNESLETLEKNGQKINLRVYTMLGAWRNTQPYTCDKILAISSALVNCGLHQLAWEICRGLDDDLLHDLALKLENVWRKLAEWLRLRPCDIKKLEDDFAVPAKRTYMVLITWRKRQHASCDLLGVLTKVLKDNNYRDIANGLVDGLHDDILDKVATLAGAEWETLASYLGFSQFDIDVIKDSHSLEPQRVYIMLCQWRYRQHYTSNRVQALLDGLAKCGLQSSAQAIVDMMGITIAQPTAALGEVSLEQLQLIAKEIGISWRLVALDLHFEREQIHKIEETHPMIKDQCYQMFMNWQEKLPVNNDGKKELINILDKLDRHDLVVNILGPQAEVKTTTSVTLIEPIIKGLNMDTGSAATATLDKKQVTSEQEHALNEDQIFNLAKAIGVYWKRVACDLGFTAKDVLYFEKNGNKPGDQCYCMLQNWQGKNIFRDDAKNELEMALKRAGLKDNAAKLFGSCEDTPMESSNQIETNYITKEQLVTISRSLNFNDLTATLNLGFSDVDTLITNFRRADQRCFQALDTWKRRGPSGERRLSELLQVLQAMNRSDLIQNLKSEASSRSASESTNHIGELTTDCDVMAPIKLTENQDNLQDEQFVSLSTYGVVEPAKEAMEGMEISMVIPADDNPHGLEVNSMVEINGKKGKLYGVIRWMGVETSLGPMAGVELEEKLEGAGTDGVLLRKRYFTCEPNRALFVKLSSVKPDSRFPSQVETFTRRSRLTSDDFGGFDSPYVKGYIQPPSKLAPTFVGPRKGIQGDHNSCYLDTTLFSMYAYTNVFDSILKRPKQYGDLPEFENVQRTLREHIVNPLRSYGFVRADRVLQLRASLDKLGTTKGLTSEEKDPEEFLHTLLQEVTKTEPFLHIRHGDHVEKSYHYQIFMEKNESYELPTVEQLLQYSFLHSDLKLTQSPPCFIMQMPRFGKDYRMYNRILPSLYLDISDLLEGWPRICTMCGQLAEYECRDCSGQISAVPDAINSYCADCIPLVHKQRLDHNPKPLMLSKQFHKSISVARQEGWSDDNIQRKIIEPRKIMELFAVVCIETSHYVAFVKAGSGPDADWVFFDSMADREGDQQGYNIPEITHLRNFRQWLESDALLMTKDDKELPSQLRRLLSDGYMCMYQDPKVVQGNLEKFPTETNLAYIVKTLQEIKENPTEVHDMEVDVQTPGGASDYSTTGLVTRGTTTSRDIPGGASGAMTGAAGVSRSKYLQRCGYSSSSSNLTASGSSPALPYTMHLGSTHSSSNKAAATAMSCYRNYTDAHENLPAEHVYQKPAAQVYHPPTGTKYDHRTDTNGAANRYDNVGQNNLARRPIHSSRNNTTPYKNEQHQGNLSDDSDFEIIDESVSVTLGSANYVLPVSSDADLYSKFTVAPGNTARYGRSEISKFEKYCKVSPTNPTATEVQLPQNYRAKLGSGENNCRDDIAHAGNGFSSRRAGGSTFSHEGDDIKHPPDLSDDFEANIFRSNLTQM